MHAKLGVYSIVMMTLATVCNLRNISSTYNFGGEIFFYYTVVCVFFFIPKAIVVSDLATKYSTHSGVYYWVSHIMGWRAGALAVFYQWLENIFYYPLSLLFIISSVAELCGYNITPLELGIMTNVVFWLLTFLNIAGLQYSARSIEILTLCGTVLPLGLLTLIYVTHGQYIGVFTVYPLVLPSMHFDAIYHPLTITTAAFLGLEMNAVHAKDIRHPHITLPMSLVVSTVLIMLCMVGGSWLMMGFIQGNVNAGNAFSLALIRALNIAGLASCAPIIIFLLLLGPLAGMKAWIIGPVHGLIQCIENLPLQRSSTLSLSSMLLLQAALVSMISVLYCVNDIQTMFLMMTDAMVALYLVMYCMLFAASYKDKATPHSLLPSWLVKITSMIGGVFSSIIIFMCFYHPDIGWMYNIIRFLGFIIAVYLPYLGLLWLPQRVNVL